MFAEMGQSARRHPEELVFNLLASGYRYRWRGQLGFQLSRREREKNEFQQLTQDASEAMDALPFEQDNRATL